MATTKRGVKARTAKKAARTSGAKKAANKPGAKRAGAAKPGGVKPGGKKTAAAKAGAKKSAARKAAATPRAKKASVRKPAAKGGLVTAASDALAALTKKLKAQFSRERSALEQRLTETVREIGLLRHHEMRAIQFERQLGERDATIAELRRELEAQKSPPSPAPPDTQAGLNFGAGGAAVGLNDLDETAALDDEDDDLL